MKPNICAPFRSASLLKRHLETHGNERKYACEQCSARFNTKNALRNHRNCVHLVVRYPCEYCEKRFDQKLTLRDHVEKVHNVIKINLVITNLKLNLISFSDSMQFPVRHLLAYVR